jgi:hypothetical protein
MTAYGFGMYGLGGTFTDPGESGFSARVRDELGVDIGDSPYRDYDVNTIAAKIMALPADAPIILWGTSLGANNTPVAAAYVYAQNPRRIIHGIWGFQASIYGARPQVGTSYDGIPPNVLFAHLTSSDKPIPLPGLGAYRWVKAPGNAMTNLHLDTVDDPHPGDGNVAVQTKYLAEMKRVIAAAGQAPMVAQN